MEIKESQTSRASQFGQLVLKHCSKLRRRDSESWALFFDDAADSSSFSETKLRVAPNPQVPDKSVFDGGEWQDLEILVFDVSYFDCVKRLAQDYEQATQRSVLIVKHF